MSKRDTYNYELKDGRKVVYRGTSNDVPRRVAEHKADGKEFTHARVSGRAKTPAGAKRAEAASLDTYRRNHNGNNPKYNQRDDG